jgi:hypothetical protein
MNKKSEAYPSYAKAIKHLNLKFRSLAEAYNYDGEVNLFENDNLISESGVAGFSQMEGLGFSNEGNLEGNETLSGVEPEVGDKVIFIKNLELKSGGGVVYISAGKEGEVDETGIGFYGGISVKLLNPENFLDDEMVYFNFNKSDYSGDYAVIKIEKNNGLNEEEEMTEAEKAIDAMLEEDDSMIDEKLVGNQDKLDMNKNGKLDSDDFSKLRSGKKGMEEMTDKEKSFAALAEPKDKITYADKIAGAKKESLSEHELGIFKTTNNMDDIIDSFTEGKIKKKVYTLK